MAEMDGKDIEWMKDQISDISHDTDEILEDTHMNDGIDYGARMRTSRCSTSSWIRACTFPTSWPR